MTWRTTWAVGSCLLLVACCGGASPNRTPSGAEMSFRLPSGESETPLLRTDGSRLDQWEALLGRIGIPNEQGFRAYVAPVADPALEGLTEDDIRGLPREDDAVRFVLVADERALTESEFPILVADFSGENLPSFRVTASCLWAVQNNLALANMDWEEFLEAVAEDGVYRDC